MVGHTGLRLMVLLSFRASVADGRVLRTSARVVNDAAAIEEPINAFLSQLDDKEFVLGAVHVHGDSNFGGPVTTTMASSTFSSEMAASWPRGRMGDARAALASIDFGRHIVVSGHSPALVSIRFGRHMGMLHR